MARSSRKKYKYISSPRLSAAAMAASRCSSRLLDAAACDDPARTACAARWPPAAHRRTAGSSQAPLPASAGSRPPTARPPPGTSASPRAAGDPRSCGRSRRPRSASSLTRSRSPSVNTSSLSCPSALARCSTGRPGSPPSPGHARHSPWPPPARSGRLGSRMPSSREVASSALAASSVTPESSASTAARR